MIKKTLFLLSLSILTFSGCGNERPVSTDISDSLEPTTNAEETISVEVTTPETTIIVETPTPTETYSTLGISAGTVSSKIKFIFSSYEEYSFQTELYDITVLLSNYGTQQCVIYTHIDSDDVLCVRFMDTHAVLVENESGSKSINKCIDAVISLLDIPETGYIAKTYTDSDYTYSYYVYPVDVDRTVLIQPKTYDVPEETASTETQETVTVDITVTPEPPAISTGQKNALKKADQYLDVVPLSYSGLISQLEYEGYSTDEATYAADNCGADWNEQAAKKAAIYLELMSFSREGLIEQLKFDGFTYEQAVYGVESNGY